MYAFPGGKLEHADFDLAKSDYTDNGSPHFSKVVENLLSRETMEETSLTIETLSILTAGSLLGLMASCVMLKFGAKYKSGEVKLSPEDHTDFAWVNTDEVGQYNTLDSVAGDIAETIKSLVNNKIMIEQHLQYLDWWQLAGGGSSRGTCWDDCYDYRSDC